MCVVQERRVVVTALSLTSRRRARQLLIPAVALVVLAADQASKTWALHHVPPAPGGRHLTGSLWLVLTFNSGAAFSLGRGVTPFIEAVVIALVVWLVVFSRRATRAGSIPLAVGLGLLLGGAAGNLADRVFRHNRGSVIDFIDAARVGSHDWWPVFNVADAAVVVGVVILVLTYRRRPATAADPPDAPGPHA